MISPIRSSSKSSLLNLVNISQGNSVALSCTSLSSCISRAYVNTVSELSPTILIPVFTVFPRQFKGFLFRMHYALSTIDGLWMASVNDTCSEVIPDIFKGLQLISYADDNIDILRRKTSTLTRRDVSPKTGVGVGPGSGSDSG